MGKIIGISIFLIIDVAFVVWLIAKGARNRSEQSTQAPPRPAVRAMRCPNCGSPATVHGNSWECGWCGDFGNLR